MARMEAEGKKVKIMTAEEEEADSIIQREEAKSVEPEKLQK